ncbi:MerR family transcriptional regulator [Fodinicola feengrottensis]|uniref:MerR family transcriptional regulator n=1 Tax=Fodinicola feengrottensis TaxID=435914 RepID=A0ABN2IHN8_9ACTN
MINIGDFGRLGGVSLRMLRHYDEMGLLRPAEVDQWTGRRRYHLDQLGDLHRIVTLKTLGFTLQQVGEMLHDGFDTAQLRGMLRMRRADFERQSQDARHRIAQIDARLALIERETGRSDPPVVVKQVESIRLAALTSVVADDEDFGAAVEELFIKACDLMNSAGWSRTSPISWYVPAAADAVRIYTGFAAPAETPGLTSVDLPAANVASVIHHGPMQDIGAANVALARWADANGHTGEQRRRSIFLEATGDDQHNWVVEVQLELPPQR